MATIKKIATELNWDLQKREAYGTVKGFDVTLVQNFDVMNSHNNFKYACIPYETLQPETGRALLDFFTKNKKTLKVNSYDVKQTLVTFRFTETLKGLNAARLTEMLDTILDEFSRLGIQPKKDCVYCDQDGTESSVYINKIKLPAHESCKQQAIEEQGGATVQGNGSLSAYLGGAVGALVGAIPYAIGVWFGWYIGLLSALAGVLSYVGYKMAGGTPTKMTKHILAVFALAGVLLSNFFLMYLVAFTYDVTVADVWAQPELKEVFTESFMMSFVFGLIGVAFVYSKVKGDEVTIR